MTPTEPRGGEGRAKTMDAVRDGATLEWAKNLLKKRRAALALHHQRFPFTIDKSMAETGPIYVLDPIARFGFTCSRTWLIFPALVMRRYASTRTHPSRPMLVLHARG